MLPGTSADHGEAEQGTDPGLLGGWRRPCVMGRMFTFAAMTEEGRDRKDLGAVRSFGCSKS